MHKSPEDDTIQYSTEIIDGVSLQYQINCCLLCFAVAI